MVILGLLLLKLAVSMWNVFAFQSNSYDDRMHTRRAAAAGLSLKGRAYNGPLYYMGTLPAVGFDGWNEADFPEKGRDSKKNLHTLSERETDLAEDLNRRLRGWNVFYLAIFYVSWIYGIFPRVLANETQWFMASLTLLILPGYQKLAAMTHPDNALAALTAAAVALWLGWRHLVVDQDDRTGAGLSWAWILGSALLAGLVPLARPTGFFVAAALWAGGLELIVRARGTLFRKLVCGLAFTTLIATIGSSWLIRQWTAQGFLEPTYEEFYLKRFKSGRKDFDYSSYLTTFHLPELIEVPNRKMTKLDKEAAAPRKPENRRRKGGSERKPAPQPQRTRFQNLYGNSFFTILYSDSWGDHWLYFSGKERHEQRLWPKRLLLVLALPVTVWLLFRLLWGAGIGIRKVVAEMWRNDDRGFILLFAFLGVCIFFGWQLTSGLTPGKNSSIKFIHQAYLVPFLICIAFWPPVARFERTLAVGFYALIFTVSASIILYWPPA